jgi:hypothetical protein
MDDKNRLLDNEGDDKTATTQLFGPAILFTF